MNICNRIEHILTIHTRLMVGTAISGYSTKEFVDAHSVTFCTHTHTYIIYKQQTYMHTYATQSAIYQLKITRSVEPNRKRAKRFKSYIHLYTQTYIGAHINAALTHRYMRLHIDRCRQYSIWVRAPRHLSQEKQQQQQQSRHRNYIDACDVTIVASKAKQSKWRQESNSTMNKIKTHNSKCVYNFEFGAVVAASTAVATASYIKYYCCCCYIEPALHCCSNRSNMFCSPVAIRFFFGWSFARLHASVRMCVLVFYRVNKTISRVL